jgi:uncharacterized protein YcbX
MTGDRVGSIVALWRYPVKSMLGEELDAAEVTEMSGRIRRVDPVTLE